MKPLVGLLLAAAAAGGAVAVARHASARQQEQAAMASEGPGSPGPPIDVPFTTHDVALEGVQQTVAGLSPFDQAYLDILAKSEAARVAGELESLKDEQPSVGGTDPYYDEMARTNQVQEGLGYAQLGILAATAAAPAIGKAYKAGWNRLVGKPAAPAPPSFKVPKASLASVDEIPARAAARAARAPAVPPAGTTQSARFSQEALEVAQRPTPKALAASREAEFGRVTSKAARQALATETRAAAQVTSASRLAQGAGRVARGAGRVLGAAGVVYAAYEGVQAGISEFQAGQAAGQHDAASGAAAVATGVTNFGSLGLVDMSFSKGEFSLGGYRQEWLEDAANSKASRARRQDRTNLERNTAAYRAWVARDPNAARAAALSQPADSMARRAYLAAGGKI